MTKSDLETPSIDNQGANFLQSDFNQCFEQARYYDSQIFGIFKYLSTFYTSVATIAVGLYQFSIEKQVNISTALITGLSIALIFGLFMLPLLIRHRAYFVYCMRYINEIRGLYLSSKPMAFVNKTGMYTNHNKPPFFNTLSSQSGWIYVLAVMNSILLGIIFYIGNIHILLSIVICGVLLLIQLISAIAYLYSKENKTASEAMFGN